MSNPVTLSTLTTLTKEPAMAITSSLITLAVTTLVSWIIQRSGVALGAVTIAQLRDMVQAILADGTDPGSSDFFVALNAAAGEEADYCEAVGDSDEHTWDSLAAWAYETAPYFAKKAPRSGVLYSFLAATT